MQPCRASIVGNIVSQHVNYNGPRGTQRTDSKLAYIRSATQHMLVRTTIYSKTVSSAYLSTLFTSVFTSAVQAHVNSYGTAGLQ